MKNIAIILASGSGERFGSKIPKQFIKLAGKPVIQYSLETFSNCEAIEEIIIVSRNDFIDDIWHIVKENNFNKVTKIISGGKERYESTLAALNSITETDANIIIHDAVRPFVTNEIIQQCVDSLKSFNAVDVVVDATDTIVKTNEDFIESIPDRRFLKRGQTPQAFRKTTLKKAYGLFLQDGNKHATDDCGVVLKYLPEEKILTIPGNESNFKITHQQDLYLADNLIKDGVFHRLEYDSNKIKKHLKNKVIVVIGGTEGIGEAVVNECKKHTDKVSVLSRKVSNTDVSNPESIAIALKEIYKTNGKIDIVVNTSGYLIKKPLSIMSSQEINDSININYLGVINVARQSYSYLKETQGMLINFTSSSYTRGRAFYSIYSSSKAAVVNFTQAIAEEWQPDGIKVIAINPERTDTPMRQKNFGNEPKETLLTAEQVAKFTLSAISFNHTGQIYSIKNDLL